MLEMSKAHFPKRSPFALAFACALACSCFAFADVSWTTWRDPNGRLIFQYPSPWTFTQMQSANDDGVRVAVGPAAFECQIWSLPRPSTSTASIDEVRRRYIQPITDNEWIETVAALNYFRGGVAITAHSVDLSGPWPIQRVTLQSPEHLVRGSLQGRPGRELISLCLSFDGQDRSDAFAAIERSLDAPPTNER
jgi:hypothetical protein